MMKGEGKKMEKAYYPLHIRKGTKVDVSQFEMNETKRYIIEFEDDQQIVRLYFDDLKSLCELMFFEVAEKIQPYMRGGE